MKFLGLGLTFGPSALAGAPIEDWAVDWWLRENLGVICQAPDDLQI
jgi:hypothetical protein